MNRQLLRDWWNHKNNILTKLRSMCIIATGIIIIIIRAIYPQFIFDEISLIILIAVFVAIILPDIINFLKEYKSIEIFGLKFTKESEVVSVTDDDNVNSIITILRDQGAHSFQWFRDNTDFAFSDEKFKEIIRHNPGHLKEVKIISHDPRERKLKMGNPGLKLIDQEKTEKM